MRHSTPPPRALIAGDVYPSAADRGALLAACGVTEQPEIFLFTLDAALAAGPPRPRQTCLAFTAEHLEALHLGQTTVAVTASNHLSDFGAGGTQATLAELDRRGLRQVGAGMDQRAARQPLELDLDAGRLAILGWAETAPRVGAQAARDQHAGVNELAIERAVQEVHQAAERADWVWAVLHWGEEYVRFPDAEQRRDARRLADAGADLVVAAHTHVPLGFERHGKASIYYGLGNFLFPGFREARGYHYRFHPQARRGLVLDGQLGRGGWSWQARGLRHDRHGLPRPATARCPNYARILDREPTAYAIQYRGLRRREWAVRVGQRLLYMSMDERRFRLRQLFGGKSGRSRDEEAA